MHLWKCTSISILAVLFVFTISSCTASKPNIVFILTDDQDVFLNGTGPMSKLKQYIGDAGATYKNMFVTTPLCCPSRSSILTGRYVHNHRAVNNSIDGNCSSPAWQQGPEREAFVTYLKGHGYTTFFAGKYLNQYGMKATGGLEHIPPGWDYWNGLKGNSVYYNYTLSINGKAEVHKDKYEVDYLTDVINRKATAFLMDHHEGRKNSDPFFMMLSTPAAHAPFTPAPQYSDHFSDMNAPRTPSFNTYHKDKHWLLRQVKTPMGNDSMAWVDSKFRDRWRTLLSVDDMIGNVVNLLTKYDALNDTYIIFASDNGFHLGQFSLPNDKRQMYEFDIRVPLMVRGPGIAPGQLKDDLVLNIDLAPTILDLASITPPDVMDGQSFKSSLFGAPPPEISRTDFLVEHQGEYDFINPGCPQYDGQPLNNCFPDCVCEDSRNNTYLCVRRLSPDQDMVYCGFSDNESFIEVYDLNKDPDQMVNIVSTVDPTVTESLAKSLTELALCSGHDCHNINSHSIL